MSGKQGGSRSGGLSQSSGGNSSITGPTGSAQAGGARRAGMTPGTGFDRKKLKASELDRGAIAGVVTVDGESLTGQATLPKGGEVRAAVDKLAEEMEKETIPIEHRDQIRLYHEYVLQGAGGAGEK